MTKKTYILAVVGFAIILAGLVYAILRGVNAWFETNRLIFDNPIEVVVRSPIRVEKRELTEKEIVRIVEKLPPYEELTNIEKYICDKWGPYNCKVAVAIARSESGLREDAYNINSNWTFDYGIFQINSIHHNEPGCAMREIVDAEGNVDCAYRIWELSGWNAWSAFKSGAFKERL